MYHQYDISKDMHLNFIHKSHHFKFLATLMKVLIVQ